MALSKLAEGADDRASLSTVFLPFFTMQYFFENPSSGLGGGLEPEQHQKLCISHLFDMLCADSGEFKSAFPTLSLFEKCLADLQTSVLSLLEIRKSVYENDAQKACDGLDGIQKQIPEIDPSNTKPFIQSVKGVQKQFLQCTDMAAEIMAAVAEDAKSFGCTVQQLCPNHGEPWQNLASV